MDVAMAASGPIPRAATAGRRAGLFPLFFSLLLGLVLLGSGGEGGLARAQSPPAQSDTAAPADSPSPPLPAASTSYDGPVTITSVVSTLVSVSTATSTATATTTTTDSTRVVSIFYLDERAFEGLPYTLLHRVCGNVLGVDGTATTYAITTTRVDLRSTSTASSSQSRSDNGTGADAATTATVTAGPGADGSGSGSDATDSDGGASASTSAAAATLNRSWTSDNATGPASTVTQGPTTFVFTGTRRGDAADRTIVNRCRLNGTTSASCNLTHAGAGWYTSDPGWNGTFSTYNYTWTSGDRFGFAPCTVTRGVEMMGPAATTTAAAEAAASSNAAAPGRGEGFGEGGGGGGAACSAVVLVAFVMGLFALV